MYRPANLALLLCVVLFPLAGNKIYTKKESWQVTHTNIYPQQHLPRWPFVQAKGCYNDGQKIEKLSSIWLLPLFFCKYISLFLRQTGANIHIYVCQFSGRWSLHFSNTTVKHPTAVSQKRGSGRGPIISSQLQPQCSWNANYGWNKFTAWKPDHIPIICVNNLKQDSHIWWVHTTQ